MLGALAWLRRRRRRGALVAQGRGRGRRGGPKSASAWTGSAQDWAELGIGDPVDYDEDGIPVYADYRPAPRQEPEDADPGFRVDNSILALVTNWQLVTVDLLTLFRIDLHDPAVLAGPWLGVRGAIHSLYSHPDSRFRRAVTTTTKE